MEQLRSNLEHVQKKITLACQESQRDPSGVKLIAVTKRLPLSVFSDLLKLNQLAIGENRTPEAKSKHEALKSLPFEWHFIGHLQTNKVKDIISFTHLIHSLDRISLAKELDKRARDLGKIQNVLIQIKTSLEESKLGLEPDMALNFCKDIASFKNLSVDGLMTMAPLTDDKNLIRASFKKLREIQNLLQKEGFKNIKDLSMGMSHDFEIAIEEGATMVRVGSSIFGEPLR